MLVGAFIAGGVAYAVTVVPPNSSDRYYACVSTTGVVRYGTMRLNAAPTSCPKATDTVRSWNAQGPQGVPGPPGATSGFGDLYFAATMQLTPVGCPPGGYKIAVVRRWGAPVALENAECMTPRPYTVDIPDGVSVYAVATVIDNPASAPTGVVQEVANSSTLYQVTNGRLSNPSRLSYNGNEFQCSISVVQDGQMSASCYFGGHADFLATEFADGGPESGPLVFRTLPT